MEILSQLGKVEHIGIAVDDLESACNLYSALLGVQPYKFEDVASEQVRTAFFRTGDTKVELLQALSPGSAISKFITKRGAGIHHIAFEVDDIAAAMRRLRDQGFHILTDKPRIGADNKRVCFIHPGSAGGVLIELCQEISETRT